MQREAHRVCLESYHWQLSRRPDLPVLPHALRVRQVPRLVATPFPVAVHCGLYPEHRGHDICKRRLFKPYGRKPLKVMGTGWQSQRGKPLPNVKTAGRRECAWHANGNNRNSARLLRRASRRDSGACCAALPGFCRGPGRGKTGYYDKRQRAHDKHQRGNQNNTDNYPNSFHNESMTQ